MTIQPIPIRWSHRVQPSIRRSLKRRNQPLVHQDTYRKVLFGQAADPIFPPHPDPPEFTDSELTRQFEADVPPRRRDARRPMSPVGRLAVLALIAATALGVFLWLWR